MRQLNWSRAKTILILAFALVNVFLYMQVGQEHNWGRGTHDPAAIKSELQRAGVDVGNLHIASLPTAMPYLTVAPILPDRESLLEALLPQAPAPSETVTHTAGRPGTDLYSWGKESLVMDQSSALVFYQRHADETCPAPSANDAEARANEFFARSLGGLPAGAVYDTTTTAEDHPCRMAVYYHMQYRGYPVWGVIGSDTRPVSGPIRVEVARVKNSRGGQTDEVVNVVEQLVSPQGYSGPPKPLIDGYTAVNRAQAQVAANLQPASLAAGYFAGTYCQVESYELPPVYRVVFDDGTVVYINAMTGRPEQGGAVLSGGNGNSATDLCAGAPSEAESPLIH